MSLRKIGTKLLKDKDFFLSEEVKNYYTQLVYRMTGKKITVLIDWNGGTGATDGKVIRASANNPFAKDMSRKHKFSVLTGLVMHEVGHILYTDFSILKEMIVHMQKDGKFYPAPTVQYDESLVDIIGRNQCLQLLKGIWNSVEDGHIECRLMEEYNAYKPEIAAMRWSQYEMTPSLEEEQQGGNMDKYSLIANRILTFAEFCDVKADDNNELLIQYVNPLLPIIKKAVLCKNAFLRASYCNDIFVQILEIIVQDIKKQSQEQSEQSDSQSQSKDNQGSGGQESYDNDQSNSNEKNSQSNAENDKADNSSSDSSSNESGEKSEQEQGNSSNSQSSSSSTENSQSTQNENESSYGSEGDLTQDEKESLRQAIQQICNNMDVSSDCDESMNSKPIKDDYGKVDESNAELSDETNGQSSNDFRWLEQKAEEQAGKNDVESKIQKELNEFPSTIDFDNMHNKIICRIHRKDIKTDDRNFKRLEKEISPMVRHIVSELKKEIKQRQQGDKLSALYVGRRLEGRNLYRQDKRVMSKNRLPEDIPDMRVCYLGDCSGSMDGEKLDKSCKMALAVYTACRTLNVPVAVYGHTDRQTGVVDILSYAEFDSVDDMDKYRIANMDSYSANRDGYALKFCVERLAKYPEKVKLLFVTSDGLPNGSYGYGSAAGAVDIQRVLKECKKKNIVVVTAGLGADKPKIEAIWQPDGKRNCKFLDLSDEAMLPKKLVRIITNYLS